MAEKFLNRADIVTTFEKLRCETVPECVGGSRFRDSRRLDGLEDIPQCELHVPRRLRCADYPVCAARDGRTRVHRPEAVGHVECLDSGFHALAFTDLERSCDRCIPPPLRRTNDVALTMVRRQQARVRRGEDPSERSQILS